MILLLLRKALCVKGNSSLKMVLRNILWVGKSVLKVVPSTILLVGQSIVTQRSCQRWLIRETGRQVPVWGFEKPPRPAVVKIIIRPSTLISGPYVKGCKGLQFLLYYSSQTKFNFSIFLPQGLKMLSMPQSSSDFNFNFRFLSQRLKSHIGLQLSLSHSSFRKINLSFRFLS